MNDLLYRSNIIDSIVADESWKPNTFRSSRQNKNVQSKEEVQKFMDDDDLKTWEANRVLVPVIRQRTTESIANQFLQFVKWQQKKTSPKQSEVETASLRQYLMFQILSRPAGTKTGLFYTTKDATETTIPEQLLKRRVSEKGRKAKKQRIGMKLSIVDDYDLDDYTKDSLPTISSKDTSKPKFIPRSSRLLTQKAANSSKEENGKKSFVPSSRSITYDAYKWPTNVVDGTHEMELKPSVKTEAMDSVPIVKLEPVDEVPNMLSDFTITVKAFKRLTIVPPLSSNIASDALKADSLPFNRDTEKQQRYIYYLKVQAELIPNSSFFAIPKSFTLDKWKHELDEFTQLAMRYRPLSFELAQRFAPASDRPVEPELKALSTRTVEKFVPVPLLLTRFGLPQIKGESVIAPVKQSHNEPMTQPIQSNVVNLYENMAIMRPKAPKSLFEKIFKNAIHQY